MIPQKKREWERGWAQGRIKVCDFGISKRLAETVHAVTVVGTPFYLAPEICESKPYGRCLSRTSRRFIRKAPAACDCVKKTS